MECDKIQCGICIEEVDAGKIIRYCGGKHVFCMDCMDQWLKNREEKGDGNLLSYGVLSYDLRLTDTHGDISFLNMIPMVPCPICQQSINIYSGYPDGVHTQYFHIKNESKRLHEEFDEDEEEFDEDEEEEEEKEKRIIREFTVKDGKLHGLFQDFYLNSQEGRKLCRRTQYVHGKREGMDEQWHPDDVGEDGEGLIERQTFLDDKANGLYQSWWPNGNLSCQFVTKDGYREGLFQRWDLNGELVEKSFFVKGCIEGLYTIWHDNGVKMSEYMMVQGKPVGICRQWDHNGLIK